MNPIDGVDNPIQRRVYNSTPIFTDITNSDGKVVPLDTNIIQLSDAELDTEATITDEDIELAFAELTEPLLISLFNANVS